MLKFQKLFIIGCMASLFGIMGVSATNINTPIFTQNDVKKYESIGYVTSDFYTTYNECNSMKEMYNKQYGNYTRSNCFGIESQYKYFICASGMSCDFVAGGATSSLFQTPKNSNNSGIIGGISSANKEKLDSVIEGLKKNRVNMNDDERFISQIDALLGKLLKLEKKYQGKKTQVMVTYLIQEVKKLKATAESESEDTNFFCELMGACDTQKEKIISKTNNTLSIERDSPKNVIIEENQFKNKSRYPGCDKDDIIGYEGYVMAGCDTPINEWNSIVCEKGYHIPNTNEMISFFGKNKQIPYIDDRTKESILVTQAGLNSLYINEKFIHYKLNDIKNEKIKKGGVMGDTYGAMYVTNDTVSMTTNTNEEVLLRKYKARCVRNEMATAIERDSGIDSIVFLTPLMALKKGGELYGMEFTGTGYSISTQIIYSIDDLKRMKLIQYYKSDTLRDFINSLGKYLDINKNQLFLGHSGDSRLKKLEDFGYVPPVVYTLNIPEISLGGTSSYVRYVRSILYEMNQNPKLSNKDTILANYGSFVPIIDKKFYPISPQKKFDMKRMGAYLYSFSQKVSGKINNYNKHELTNDEKINVMKRDDIIMFELDEMSLDLLEKEWEKYRLVYLLNDIQDGRIKNSTEANEILYTYYYGVVLGANGNYKIPSTEDDFILLEKNKATLKEKYRERKLWALTLEMPGKIIYEYWKPIMSESSFYILNDYLSKNKWPDSGKY